MPARTASALNSTDDIPLSLQPPPPQRRAMEHALSLPEILGHILYCLDLSEEATANDYGLSSSGHGGLGFHGGQAPASSSASLLLSSKSHSGAGHDRMMCKTGSLRACALVSRFWYQACKPILWRKVHYSKSNLGAMVIHLQPYDNLHHNKRARSSRHPTATITNNNTSGTTLHATTASCSQSPPTSQDDAQSREQLKGESAADAWALLSATSPCNGIDLGKYLLDQVPMGRFLPGMIQNARLIRHLKPWPGFLHRDLELIGDLCGATLESLDLSLTRWSSINHTDMLAYMARHSPSPTPAPSSAERPPLAGHKDPIHISPATTKSLEQLISKLTRLQALSVNHAIGLDMNEVLRFLTRMFGEERERLEHEGSLEQRWTSRRGSSSSSSSTSSTSARSSPLGWSSSRRLSLRRFEMNGQQNYDEEALVAFLETCCAFPRQCTSSTATGHLLPHINGSAMHSGQNYVLKDSIPGIRSLSIKRNALSASLNGLWAPEENSLGQSLDEENTAGSFNHAATTAAAASGGGLQNSTALNNAGQQQPQQQHHQHHHGPLQLEELFLDNNNLSSLTLHNLTRRCPFLRTITLSNNRRLTSLGMHVLSEHCPLLAVVHLDGCISIDNGGFQQLFLRCTELEDVRLSRTSVDDMSILALLGEGHLGSCSSTFDLPSASTTTTTTGAEARGGVWKSQHDIGSHSSQPSTATTRLTSEKRAKLRCIHLQNCPSITERSVRALLTSCSSLESLDISQNRQLRVTGLFCGNNTCQNCRPAEPETWACSQSLRYLDMADIDYTPLQDQYELKACREYDDASSTSSGSTLSPPNSIDMDAYYREVELAYQGMYHQLSELTHLQSLAMGSHEFVLVLEPPATPAHAHATAPEPALGPHPPVSAKSGGPARAGRDGLVRVLRSLKHLHLVSLSKIDVEQSTELGFKELRWMIESMSSPMMRQLLLGQGLGFSTGFGNGIVEANKRYKVTAGGAGPGRRSPSPVLLPGMPMPLQQGRRSTSTVASARTRTPSPDLNGVSSLASSPLLGSSTSSSSHGGSAMGLIDISCMSPPSLVATEETLIFTRQDQLDKMDDVDRDMDSSEAFMAWCRATRPLLRVCVLEW